MFGNHSKGRTQGVNSELEGQQTHILFYFYQVAPAFLPHPVITICVIQNYHKLTHSKPEAS